MIEKNSLSAADLRDIREKYRYERDKRTTHSGRGVRELDGDLRRYLDDPFTPANPREAVFDEVEVVCIGAGFAGLLAGANFRRRGFDRIRLIDSAGDVGGVWYWNRYPEAKCDVHSLIYMPLLEETGYVPSQRYAPAPEIAEHARRIATLYGLYEHALFHTTVTELRWDDVLHRWHVRTDRGDDILAQFVALCPGPLSKVKLADIPGVEDFRGTSFHTSRWDYAYTGGTPSNPTLERLHDKVVGFIGTGATGLQCVAPLGRAAKKFYLFQRTPSTVGVRGNGPIDADEIHKLEPGWQKRAQEVFTDICFGAGTEEYLVVDGWTDLNNGLQANQRYKDLRGKDLALEKERVDFEKMEAIRRRIDSVVKDRDTAEKLKPYYNYMCKRPGWHDEYLEAFNLPTVELVDTQGRGVERITEKGVVANGKEYKLDCLVFGTGFETETIVNQRLGVDVYGKAGVSLADKWADGVATLHGITTAGFPNFFLVPAHSGQAVVTTNVVHMTQEYTHHMAYIAGTVRENGWEVFNVSQQAEAQWVETILARRVDRSAFLEACTPGRNNAEGNYKARPLQNSVFGGTASEYFGILRAWRESGRLPGLEMSVELGNLGVSRRTGL